MLVKGAVMLTGVDVRYDDEDAVVGNGLNYYC